VHNASILNAVGACGLQLYRYGEARPNTLGKAYEMACAPFATTHWCTTTPTRP
jgi:diphthamide biosynthesis methyltransferase